MSRLPVLDQLRAIAILSIVFLHSGRTYFLRGPEPHYSDHDLIFALNDIIFHDTTIYFTLISAIIYARSLHKKGALRYWLGRLENVVLPYIVVTIFFTTIAWQLGRRSGSAESLWQTIVHNIIWGEAIYVLWYIPVVVIIYLLAPLLFSIVHNPKTRWFAVLLCLMPLIFSREGTDVTLPTIAYFLGAFMVALFIGIDFDNWLDFGMRHQFALWAISAFCSLILFVFYQKNILKLGITDLRESVFYILRMASGLALISYLVRVRPIEGRSLKNWLSWIAGMAFGLYFLHAFILRIVLKSIRVLWDDKGFVLQPLIMIPLIYVITLVLCAAFITLSRKAAGRYSKLLIGA